VPITTASYDTPACASLVRVRLPRRSFAEVALSTASGRRTPFRLPPLFACGRVLRSFYAWYLRIVSLAEVSVACLHPARVSAAPPGVY
jgi:hypothetical protein